MDARQLFLIEHARLHAIGSPAGPRGFSLQESVLRGLDQDQLRVAPPGMNSIAWILWHMSRIEDAAANLLASDGEQVLTAGGWGARLGAAEQHVGTGMDDAEVGAFSSAVEIGALLAYREAVAVGTRAVVASLSPEDWDAMIPDARVDRAVAAGTAGPHSRGLVEFWRGRTVGWLLSWMALGHAYQHLGEAACTRSALRRA